MATRLTDKLEAIGNERRKKVEARAAQLIAEEMALCDLRKAHHLTQERMADFLGIGQEGVSRIEKRSDLLLSTLRSYIEAMGGQLRLVAEFPDRPPMTLTGFSSIDEQPTAPHRKKQRSTDRRGGGTPRRNG